jgi:dTDP-glucose 4,6-dehydratase
MPRAVVTGAAGFLGSHLSDRLVDEGWEVVCVDSLITGRRENVAHLPSDRFSFLEQDVAHRLDVPGPVDWVMHLASLASPVDYLRHPMASLEVGALGTFRALDLARAKEATILLASTSEVYGDPTVHPQPETYWGNVNPVGPRSVYDEAKRYSEALVMAHHRTHGTPIRIARIFNTFGPRMRAHDGRAVPTFIRQGLQAQAITVHGDGRQTRSLCFVDDLIEGLWRLLFSDLHEPVNLGNPEEITVADLARLVLSLTGGRSDILFVDRPEDDPQVRCPDISLARATLGWEPKTPLVEGLKIMIDWARSAWAPNEERG